MPTEQRLCYILQAHTDVEIWAAVTNKIVTQRSYFSSFLKVGYGIRTCAQATIRPPSPYNAYYVSEYFQLA